MTIARGQHDDEGFSLIEAVIAASILAVSAMIVAGLLIGTLGVTQDGTRRTTAANIAASQIEAVQQIRTLDIPDGRVVLPAVANGGTTYTVIQDATYVSTGADSACTANSDLAYKRITVTVTWPNMGSTEPIRTDTLRALGFGNDDLAASKGAAAVKVIDNAGDGVAGVPITIRNSSGVGLKTLTSDGDGCVVFTSLTPGNFSAAVNVIGMVNTDGAQSHVSPSFGVEASKIALPVIAYAPKGTLSATLVPPAGYTVPAGLSLNVNTTRWSTGANRAFRDCSTVPDAPAGCVSGTATVRTATSLFPENYKAWAGTCQDAEPVTAAYTPVTAGGTTSVSSALGGVRVTSTVGVTTQLYAVHTADSRCGSGEVIPLGTLGPLATARYALPYGTWTIKRTSTVSAVITQQVVLTASNPTPSTPVLVTL